MSTDIRILLLADSHLGFDLPVRPRVVVHAGDVFDRPTVLPTIAYQAYEPLRRIADRGVPVFIVPGNHERSRLPHVRFASHSRVHVFDRPRTFVVDVRGTAIALSGFPYERRNVRTRFAELVEETGWREQPAAIRALCIHHCVEGATVGPGDFTFTTADDVIRARNVPPDFAAVFSGHIHRHQVLTTDLQRRPVSVPILYPGSIERTSFAEIGEPKGFMVVRLGADAERRACWEFRRLPARPMMREEIALDAVTGRTLVSAVRAVIESAPPDAVLSIRVAGSLTDADWRALSAPNVRALVPETMNVEIRPADGFDVPHPMPARTSLTASTEQLSLYEAAAQA